LIASHLWRGHQWKEKSVGCRCARDQIAATKAEVFTADQEEGGLSKFLKKRGFWFGVLIKEKKLSCNVFVEGLFDQALIL
jgi:hypothetical protein